MTMGRRIFGDSTCTAISRWLTSAFGRRSRRSRRCPRWPTRGGEVLERRELLSAMAVVEWGSEADSSRRTGPADTSESSAASSVSARQAPEGQAERPKSARGTSRAGSPLSARGAATKIPQRYVEVLVFIDSGPFNTGHADIALTDASGTTVYGQHGRGAGNGGFEDSAFRRRKLEIYLRDEASAGFQVYVSQIPVTGQQFREIKNYLDHQWQNDADFNVFDDNCSQNVGFVLKRWDLLVRWDGDHNVLNDDAFQLPEGDLYDDFIRDDTNWTHRDAGYLSPTPKGASLLDSVQNRPPTRSSSNDGLPSGGSTGGRRGSRTGVSTGGRWSNGGGGRSVHVASSPPEDSHGESDWSVGESGRESAS